MKFKVCSSSSIFLFMSLESSLLPDAVLIAARQMLRGEWPSGLNSFRQVTEVKLGRVRSDSGWVTSEA